MQTWCIYIDESGASKEPQFIYAAICFPFNSQQEFLNAYPEIVNPLVHISGREIKYGHLLNTLDRHYQEEIGQICQELLTHFLKIKDVQIIRVKAIRNKMRLVGGDLRAALFRKTLELCKESLPLNHHAMILHDEIDSRNQQGVLLDTFNNFNKDLSKDPNFQNCVFVHSNENPFIQFADFVAAICYRYYYFQTAKYEGYKDRQHCKLLVNSLFRKIDQHSPSIVELSEHTNVEGNPRRAQALQLVSEHDIPPETAYEIVDNKITLKEVLRRKQASQLASEHRIRFETAYKIVNNEITLKGVLRQKQASQLISEHDIPHKTAYEIVDNKITLEEVLRRRKQASQLVSEHGIDLATAYQIVDNKITLEEVLRRKQDRTR